MRSYQWWAAPLKHYNLFGATVVNASSGTLREQISRSPCVLGLISGIFLQNGETASGEMRTKGAEIGRNFFAPNNRKLHAMLIRIRYILGWVDSFCLHTSIREFAMPFSFRCCWLVLSLSFVGISSSALDCAATEFVRLDSKNWVAYAPTGKEADAIYGDYVLRNDQIVAVIGDAISTRNANMTTKAVGGSLIDLTTRKKPNDQLTAYYPVQNMALRFEGFEAEGASEDDGAGPIQDEPKSASGETVRLTFRAEANPTGPAAKVIYSLSEGDDALLITTLFSNPHDEAIEFPLVDPFRMDKEFTKGFDKNLNLFWSYDPWWDQAYGIVGDGVTIAEGKNTLKDARPSLRFVKEGKQTISLAPGKTFELKRWIFPGKNMYEVHATANRLAKKPLVPVKLRVTDENGPVVRARVRVKTKETKYLFGVTDKGGLLSIALPPGECHMVVRAMGRSGESIDLNPEGDAYDISVKMKDCSYVEAKITDVDGNPIPCKVDFLGLGDTPSPKFGPDSGVHGVRNLYYSENGAFHIEIAPGEYDVLISHGNECDAVKKKLVVKRNQTATLEAKLIRSVDTTGWLSSDIHSHSSPSGDNTASQRGRVLNHLAEQIEFAPCTEHNRISTYIPHLEHFKAKKLLATCSGMELTGQPLPINHQNAFPLKMTPHVQDGGAPQTSPNPEVQIERLALWDNASDKLVQTNHPNLIQMLGDKDLDGKADGGFSKMFNYMDVFEVHPPGDIFAAPPKSIHEPGQEGLSKPIFHWMQMLNLGYRIPGTVNSDAHYNYHGVGWLRNYVKSPTDDPSQAKIMALCHEFEHGHSIMTNAPFMEVEAIADGEKGVARAGVGDDLRSVDGRVTLRVKIQCPNWTDINRVQAFVNGVPQESLIYERATHPNLFKDGVVKFDHKITVELKKDAHLIVAACGVGMTLGRVYGPEFGNAAPVVVANPIFVDVDGEGFQANGDLLGLELPLDKTNLPKGHRHGHSHE